MTGFFQERDATGEEVDEDAVRPVVAWPAVGLKNQRALFSENAAGLVHESRLAYAGAACYENGTPGVRLFKFGRERMNALKLFFTAEEASGQMIGRWC